MTTQKLMKKGFTLIEIVIVLAIAALIMVIVFLAVQGAQRSQRDQGRKDLANKSLSAISSYKGNHSGAFPDGSDAGHSLDSYVGVNALTINNQTYSFAYSPASFPTAGADCDANSTLQVSVRANGTANEAAVCLEGGGFYVATD